MATDGHPVAGGVAIVVGIVEACKDDLKLLVYPVDAGKVAIGLLSLDATVQWKKFFHFNKKEALLSSLSARNHRGLPTAKVERISSRKILLPGELNTDGSSKAWLIKSGTVDPVVLISEVIEGT